MAAGKWKINFLQRNDTVYVGYSPGQASCSGELTNSKMTLLFFIVVYVFVCALFASFLFCLREKKSESGYEVSDDMVEI